MERGAEIWLRKPHLWTSGNSTSLRATNCRKSQTPGRLIQSSGITAKREVTYTTNILKSCSAWGVLRIDLFSPWTVPKRGSPAAGQGNRWLFHNMILWIYFFPSLQITHKILWKVEVGFPSWCSLLPLCSPRIRVMEKVSREPVPGVRKLNTLFFCFLGFFFLKLITRYNKENMVPIQQGT